MKTYDHEISDIEYQTAIEMAEHSLFTQLKPTLKKDGNQWCVLYGDNLEDGVVGFGDSPNLAIQAFNTAWYKKITPVDEIFSGTKEALDNIKLL